MTKSRPVLIKGEYYPSVNDARKKLKMPRIKLSYLIDGPSEDYRYATLEEIHERQAEH